MNRPIVRLFWAVMLLFGVLIVGTTWNTVLGAQGLRDNPLNRRQLIEAQLVPRGTIYAADHRTVLAHSHPAPGGIYVRDYPQGPPFAHAVGYSYLSIGQAALERTANDALTGQTESVSGILDQLQGRRRVGDDVVTTLDAGAQRLAYDQLAGNRGSVVALDPATGRVLVLASRPSYDPNSLGTPGVFSRLNLQTGTAPLVDRATQSGYPPGSTFKTVTAAAALDSGRYTPSSTVNGNSPQTFSGQPLSNDGNQSFGPVDLTTALTQSINTVWANVAVGLGRSTMGDYMRRFGFYRQPPLDLPANEVAASGERLRGRLIPPTSSYVDLGRMGIGQDKLSVTPLQMAMVAAAIANGGRLMRPHLVDRVLDRDGRTVSHVASQPESTVMSGDAAGKLGAMMARVVQEGTGTAAALSGVSVAGKTGTAEVGRGRNQVWFIAFAPVNHPRVAISVTLENQDSSAFGGPVAGPIAKAVLQRLLGAAAGG